MSNPTLKRSKLGEMLGDLDERPLEMTTFPGRDGSDGQPAMPIALWPLTGAETTRAKTKAYEWVRKVLKYDDTTLAWDDYQAIDDRIMAETLAIAMRDPDDPLNPLAHNADDVMDRMSSQVQQNLWKQYLVWQAKNAFLDHVEDANRELDELVELGKRRLPLRARISKLDTLSLRVLLLSLVDRHVSSLESNSPDSSFSNGSSPSGSEPSGSASPTSDPPPVP